MDWFIVSVPSNALLERIDIFAFFLYLSLLEQVLFDIGAGDFIGEEEEQAISINCAVHSSQQCHQQQ